MKLNQVKVQSSRWNQWFLLPKAPRCADTEQSSARHYLQLCVTYFFLVREYRSLYTLNTIKCLQYKNVNYSGSDAREKSASLSYRTLTEVTDVHYALVLF